MIYCYSGTGNSRFVATVLAKLTNDAVCDIADNRQPEQENTSLLGFVFPVYGWQPPKIIRRFIATLQSSIAQDRFVYTVLTCGDDIGKTLRMFAGELRAKGIFLNSAYSIKMPDVYVCLPGFDVDSDGERHDKFRMVAQRIPHIASEINARTNCTDVFEGLFPRTKTYVLGALFYKFLVKDTPFHPNDKCDGCGICAKKCPVINIRIKNYKPTWQGHCEGCLNCYHSCPHHAINFGKRTQHKGQYTFARHYAEMKEIMRNFAGKDKSSTNKQCPRQT